MITSPYNMRRIRYEIARAMQYATTNCEIIIFRRTDINCIIDHTLDIIQIVTGEVQSQDILGTGINTNRAFFQSKVGERGSRINERTLNQYNICIAIILLRGTVSDYRIIFNIGVNTQIIS